MNKSVILVLCVLVSSTVVAQVASTTDKDARREEMRAKAEARFAESDRNRDGKLSFTEWQEARNQTLREHFAKLDGNKDGALTQDEMRQAHEQRKQMRGAHRKDAMAGREKLRALDVDQDQALTRAEIGDSMPKLSENFDAIDLNNDGKLTREEMRAGREAMRGQKR